MDLRSKTIKLRTVIEEDADFILSLRLDPRYNLFLSKVDNNIQAQKKWISAYKELEKSGQEYYFIIERLDGTACGTVRLYDFREDSFCWGSWILNDNKTASSALESALLVYKFGFDYLKYTKCHFDVMKTNEKVISFHKKLGAEITNEDAKNYYFEIFPHSIAKIKKRYG